MGKIKKNRYTFKNIVRYIRRLYSLYFVCTFWSHWFNPFYTLYFNLIFFPFRQAIRLPAFVYGWPRLYSQFGQMECMGYCKTGMVKINLTLSSSPQYSAGNTELEIWGKIIFRGKCLIGSGIHISVGTQGLLDMGEDTKIMNSCNCTIYSTVRIGAHSRIVHRSQIFDSNFHYIADFKHGVVKRDTHPISIGDYCWICNSTTIMGGTVIPNKTIVTSNSLVNKDMSNVPEESLIGGIPAKLIATGYRKVENSQFTYILDRYFAENPDQDYYVLLDDIDHAICDRKN